MQFHKRKRAIILGQGVGGITAAIALQQVGIEVAVFTTPSLANC